IPNRGPCLMTPIGTGTRLRTPALVFLRVRDRWEDVGRSLIQLVLGTYMVWDARRLRLCERYFDEVGRRPT
ncbi:MAG TPA: cytochrome P450, partial [Micromonosporaceae bacterium]